MGCWEGIRGKEGTAKKSERIWFASEEVPKPLHAQPTSNIPPEG